MKDLKRAPKIIRKFSAEEMETPNLTENEGSEHSDAANDFKF